MTICIGMLAQDGIVFAADAEESDTYIKRSQQKIMTWNSTSAGGTHTPAACVVTGAGDAGFVDAFIGEFLIGLRQTMTIDDFEVYAKKKLEGFYSTHVRPLLKVDSSSDFSVLVGAYFGWGTRLYKSYRTVLSQVNGLVTAIGVGQQYALRLMDEFPFSDARHTELIAAAVISGTKDYIEGCGKYTDVVVLHNPKIENADDSGSGSSKLVHPDKVLTRVSREKIIQWEAAFADTWKRRERLLYMELIQDAVKIDPTP